MAYYVGSYEKQLTVRPKQQAPLRSELGPVRPCPTLLLMTRMIAQAYHDALECDYAGLPTESARDAVSWLSAHTDWTRRPGPIPSEDLRREFPLTFEHCCRWLEYDPEEIRQHGMPREHGNLQTGSKFDDSRHVAGLGAVYAHWQARREHYQANKAEIDAKHSALLQRRAAAQARNRAKFAERARLKYAAAKAEKLAALGLAPKASRDSAGVTRVLPYTRDPWQSYTNFAFLVGVTPMIEPEWRCCFG